MQCPRCGTQVAPGAPSCPGCGLAAPAAAPQESSSGTGSRRRTSLVVGAVLTAIAVIVTGTVAGVLLYRGSGSGSGSGAGTSTGTSSRSASDTTPTANVFPDFAAVYEDVQTGVAQIQVQTCRNAVAGTGFLVSPTLMATAAHVVERASSLQVQLENGTVPATIYGVDLSHDLALLELDSAVDGHVFVFASRDPNPGTRIAAIGFPLGEPKTLTEGTVSGLDRHIETQTGSFDGLLQTDTAINPGNSGGPLVDTAGRVVGVADAIRTDAQGIGFAVPATIASGLTSNALQTQPLETC